MKLMYVRRFSCCLTSGDLYRLDARILAMFVTPLIDVWIEFLGMAVLGLRNTYSQQEGDDHSIDEYNELTINCSGSTAFTETGNRTR
jgi:hypothetical protein